MDIETAKRYWEYGLIAENKRPRTIETYLLAVDQLKEWLGNRNQVTEVDEITGWHVKHFIGDKRLETSAATAKQRWSSLSQFFGWLFDEGEITENPMANFKAPKVVEKPVPLIPSDDHLAMLASCDDSFMGRRDRAILSLLWDTGLRLSEVTGLNIDDVNLREQMLWVEEGKGGKSRGVPFTAETAAILSRYMMRRERHKASHLPNLWLGERGALGDRGISQMVSRRAHRALVGHVHVHQYRHSATDRLLSLGLSEGEVMSILGWSEGSRSMLGRYGRAGAERRAHDSYRRLVG